MPMQSKLEDDIFEEDGQFSSKSGKNSARSTPTHNSSAVPSPSTQRKASRSSNRSQSPSQHISPTRGLNDRSVSPRDSLNINKEDSFDKEKTAYINHAKNVDILMSINH